MIILSYCSLLYCCRNSDMPCLTVTWLCFFFFKQKTAYEMRISDWSSDVCSSDLAVDARILQHMRPAVLRQTRHHDAAGVAADARRRVHANHHPAQAGMRPRPALLQQRPRPERAFDILDQFAVQFLSAKARAAIARLDMGQARPGQLFGIVPRDRQSPR